VTEFEARGELVRAKLFCTTVIALGLAGLDDDDFVPPWPVLPGDRADAPVSGRPPAWLRKAAMAKVEASGWPAPVNAEPGRPTGRA
jgi:hypothetical protein